MVKGFLDTFTQSWSEHKMWMDDSSSSICSDKVHEAKISFPALPLNDLPSHNLCFRTPLESDRPTRQKLTWSLENSWPLAARLRGWLAMSSHPSM